MNHRSPAGSDEAGVPGLVDHLFRHESGRLVSTLTRIFGPARLELAEDVAQEALLRALRVWSVRGVPDEPAAWLQRVAQNLALDAVRRESSFREKEDEVRAWMRQAAAVGESAPDELDDSLGMLFLCCHDALPRDAQIPLTLKAVGGFSVEEIARALLARPATVAQRIVRAKARLREPGVRFERPGSEALGRRLATVLDVVYLTFNEGYESSAGDALVRRDLVEEALRWGALLVRHPSTSRPEVHALLALMHLHAARLDARTDAAGHLLLLEDQDRARWDRRCIALGMGHLKASMEADRLSRFHLEAGIASCHVLAPSFEQTNWAQIARYYDQLSDLAPSPVVELNRAVAVSMRDGPEAGLAMLRPLAGDPALGNYPLFDAVLGELLRRTGDEAGARAAFVRARDATRSRPVRELLERKLRG